MSAQVYAAVGRIVIATGAMEHLVLLGTVNLRSASSASGNELLALVDELEPLPAGRRISAFRKAGGDRKLVARLHRASGARNKIVHDLVRDPRTIAALAEGAVTELLDHLGAVGDLCEAAVLELHAEVLPQTVELFGVSDTSDLAALVHRFELADISDPTDQAFVEKLGELSEDSLRDLFGGKPPKLGSADG